jgi:hypothetical protein
MRLLIALALCCAAGAASGQTPETETGARPGNIIGTGMSLPMSDKAGNLDAATTHSALAPNLPAPQGPEDVRSLLLAAQEALERAETRALDRSVPVGTEHVPARDPLVMAVTQARGAMAAGDDRGAMAIIDDVLRQP